MRVRFFIVEERIMVNFRSKFLRKAVCSVISFGASLCISGNHCSARLGGVAANKDVFERFKSNLSPVFGQYTTKIEWGNFNGSWDPDNKFKSQSFVVGKDMADQYHKIVCSGDAVSPLSLACTVLRLLEKQNIQCGVLRLMPKSNNSDKKYVVVFSGNFGNDGKPCFYAMDPVGMFEMYCLDDLVREEKKGFEKTFLKSFAKYRSRCVRHGQIEMIANGSLPLSNTRAVNKDCNKAYREFSSIYSNNSNHEELKSKFIKNYKDKFKGGGEKLSLSSWEDFCFINLSYFSEAYDKNHYDRIVLDFDAFSGLGMGDVDKICELISNKKLAPGMNLELDDWLVKAEKIISSPLVSNFSQCLTTKAQP